MLVLGCVFGRGRTKLRTSEKTEREREIDEMMKGVDGWG